MRRAGTLVALVLALVAGPASAQTPSVEVLSGVVLATASDAEAGAQPFARVLVGMDLAKWKCGEDGWRCSPRLIARIDFAGTSSAVVNLTDPTTFRSVDFAGGIAQRFSPDFLPALYCEAGATALFGDTQGAGALRWGGCGVRLADDSGRGYLHVVFTGDQRLGNGYRPALAIQGSIALYRSDGKGPFPKGARLSLMGQAIFGIQSEAWAPGEPSSAIVAGIAVGGGR